MFRYTSFSNKLTAAFTSLVLSGFVFAITILPAMPSAGGGMMI